MVEPRQPIPTVKFIDEYCQIYQNIFPEVRSFEAFKYLHMGMVSELKRKTLPEIGKVVGLSNHQPLHHFLTESPWNVEELRRQRLELILYVLQGRPVITQVACYATPGAKHPESHAIPSKMVAKGIAQKIFG
jgi:SRSO17 transposase